LKLRIASSGHVGVIIRHADDALPLRAQALHDVSHSSPPSPHGAVFAAKLLRVVDNFPRIRSHADVRQNNLNGHEVVAVLFDYLPRHQNHKSSMFMRV
jgi:hypothetical protein